MEKIFIDVKGVLGIFALALFFLVGCQKKELDFCQMLELDQSHVNYDRSDTIKMKNDRKIRKELIKNNFKDLIEYAKYNSFPEMGEFDVTGVDSCRNWAVFLTCFHIGQTAPHLYFEEETIEVLTREIEKGNLEGSSLFTSFREGFRSHEFCESQKDLIQNTLASWEINIDELPEIRYKKCIK